MRGSRNFRQVGRPGLSVIKNLRQRFSLGFLCPQRNFGRHIVIAQSVRASVRPSRFVSGAYLLDSLR